MAQSNFTIPVIGLNEAHKVDFFHATDNLAKLCIVYEKYLDTKECQDFLEKVFTAVDLDLKSQISSFRLKEGEGFSLSLNPEFQHHDTWICFGTPLQTLGLNLEIEKYKVLEFMGKKFLWADNPSKIISDPNLKKQLWISLQKLFPKT